MVGPVLQACGSVADPLARLGTHLAAAVERLGGCANGHAGGAGHVVNGGHRAARLRRLAGIRGLGHAGASSSRGMPSPLVKRSEKTVLPTLGCYGTLSSARCQGRARERVRHEMVEWAGSSLR